MKRSIIPPMWKSLLFLLPAFLSGAEVPAISFDQLGVEAQKQYTGDGIRIVPGKNRATLKAVMQRLEAQATPEGLWITSTADEDSGTPNRFRVRAAAVTRGSFAMPLQREGFVRATPEVAAFVRPGLIEEYRTGMDGIRQDFVIPVRPAGEGELAVELEISGARAEAADYGAKLTVTATGRGLAYSRLLVTDATGAELAAHMEVVSPGRLRLAVDDAAAVYPVRVDPTFSDANWVSMGQSPGTNGAVHALAMSDDDLYVGGEFSMAGGVAALHIAKWNGNEWSALGTGVSGGFPSSVRSFVVKGNDLYVGGNFTTAGGVAVNGIAKWNGSEWSSLGSGVGNGTVFALAMNGEELYAGGHFTMAGGVAANRIAKWNGSEWSALGSGTSGSVYALAVNGGDLYAGGEFITAGGVSVNRIAKWDGSEWSSLGSGMSGSVYALAVSGGNLYAGGEFPSGNWTGTVAKWDGNGWSDMSGESLSGISGSSVNALAASGGHLYAGVIRNNFGGSSRFIARWDGSAWSILGSGVSGGVSALAISGGDLYAAVSSVDGLAVNGIARWNGGWSPLGSGANGSVSALAANGDDLYVAGSFTTIGGVTANGIAKWNGSTWSALGSGLAGASVSALAVIGGDLYVGGDFSVWVSGAQLNRIARWDGGAWHALGTGTNNAVMVLEANDGDLYVGGMFSTAGGVPANGVAKWNGSVWSALGTGVSSPPFVRALAVSGGDLYVGGLFTSAGGITVNNIAKWNGSAWSALGSGTGSSSSPLVFAIAVNGSDLYAGGNFTAAGGVAANRIAKWNGSTWSALGSGMDGSVQALAMNGDDLYAGGNFTAAGGVAANRIAKWDGNTWSALGTGMGNGAVSVLAMNGDDLYAGGSFIMVGGKSSPYLAKAVFSTESSPEIVVEQPAGTSLISGVSTLDFGMVVLEESVSLEFIVRNSGETDLTNITASVTGAHAGDFSITQNPPSTLAPEGSAVFIVAFTPSGTGASNATLSISSNAPFANPFTIALAGQGTTALVAFESELAASGLSGEDAEPDATPFGDGVENLLKYAFNMNLAGPDVATLVAGTGNSGLPAIGLNGEGEATVIRVEFIRRKNSGLTYTPKRSSTLAPGSFEPLVMPPVVTPIDAVWERVVFEESADFSVLPASFIIVEVSLP